MLFMKNAYRNIFFLFLVILTPSFLHSDNWLQFFGQMNTSPKAVEKEVRSRKSDSANEQCRKKHRKLSYYLYIADFIKSFISIPTSNVLADSSTVSSKYLAGRAPLYNLQNEKVGICSASFLCMQNSEGIFTDIANYLSVDNGLIITWFTPTTLINLELDSIVHSMVTECLVEASTKVGFNPFYGKTFNMVVSSDNEKIYFDLTKL